MRDIVAVSRDEGPKPLPYAGSHASAVVEPGIAQLVSAWMFTTEITGSILGGYAVLSIQGGMHANVVVGSRSLGTVGDNHVGTAGAQFFGFYRRWCRNMRILHDSMDTFKSQSCTDGWRRR